MNPKYLKSVEYNIVEHCNLTCAGCDHASPVMGKTFIDIEAFRSDLLALKDKVAIGTFKLLGGEPTLHPKLLQFMEIVKLMPFIDKLCVITNGTALHKMDEAFFAHLDILQITFYPGVSVPMSRRALEEKRNQYGFQLDMEDKTRFRNTIIDFPNEDKALVEKIYASCELPKVYACHTIRGGKFYKCSPAAFTKDRLAKVGMYFSDQGDAISIHGEEFSPTSLQDYLQAQSPLPSCRFCLGTCGTFFDYYQVPRAELKVTKSVSASCPSGEVTDLIDLPYLHKRLASLKS
ncbi:radical SAM protein [Pedobacter aquatilis]|uniref:radical SAM protein n=1 Tax=Pedobacter aquatilis TaxID=351343 RepID=UPI00292CA8AD|nr:radical SAM protein [Pedobacter aquatilis]